MYCQLLFLLVVSGFVQIKSEADKTLTTALMRDNISPKPTAVYKRINVEPNFEGNTFSPLDLFQLEDMDLRRFHSNVWNWDFWCHLQPKTGNCSKSINRYYYDARLDQCLLFGYSGCGGNKNRFETLTDCERYCKGASFMTINNTEPKEFCSLQADAGLCIAMFYKYYYDVNDNKCKTFIYGGCGGNQNSFSTMTECVKTCRDADDETSML